MVKEKIYTTAGVKRKRKKVSLVRVPSSWLDCSKYYDIIYDGKTIEIIEGTHRRASKKLIYANILVEWEAGMNYRAWREDGRVFCSLLV